MSMQLVTYKLQTTKSSTCYQFLMFSRNPRFKSFIFLIFSRHLKFKFFSYNIFIVTGKIFKFTLQIRYIYF